MSKTIENVLTSSGFCWQAASAARMTFDIEMIKKNIEKNIILRILKNLGIITMIIRIV